MDVAACNQCETESRNIRIFLENSTEDITGEQKKVSHKGELITLITCKFAGSKEIRI